MAVKLAGQEMNDGALPMYIGRLVIPNESDEDVSAVHRPNQKSRSESDNERKSSDRQAAVLTPTTPRHPSPAREGGHKTVCAQGETACQDECWKQHEHHMGGRRCAQADNLSQPSA